IESLMPRPALAPAEQVTVSHQFQQALSNTAEWLRLAASTPPRPTAEAAIVTPAATTRSALKHIEAVPISEGPVLPVAVLEGGAVLQQLLELRDPVTIEQLRRLSARLTQEFEGTGASAIADASARESGVDQLVTAALARLIDEHDAGRGMDVYYDGI